MREYIALISLLAISVTFPAKISVGLGILDATLRCAINLTAKPSPTDPLTKSVVVVSSSSSSSNSLTNDHERGVAKERDELRGSKSYKSFFAKVKYPTTSLWMLLSTAHWNQSPKSTVSSKWIKRFANGAGILYVTPLSASLLPAATIITLSGNL